MKITRRIVTLLFVVILSLSLSACVSVDFIGSEKSFNGYSASDLMSNDDSLANLAMETPVNASYGLTSFYSSSESVNGNINTLSGIYSLYEIQAENDTEIAFDLEFDTKQIKLVSTHESKKVSLISDSEEKKRAILPIEKGKTIIALVGNRGKGTIKIDNIELDLENATINTIEDDFD